MLIVVLRSRGWPVQLAIAILALLLLDTLVFSPQLLAGAFNPVTTNAAGIVLGLIALSGVPERR